jgi:hypothetical protein
VQGRRQSRRLHQELTGKLEAQRRAFQQSIWIGAYGSHQAQGLAVGANQDVLAVVDREVTNACRASAPTNDA